MTTRETPPASINFHFDPACPLAWRTALWMREVREVRPVDVTWRFFSLEVVNRKEGVTPDFQKDGSWAAHRTLALARRQGGNAAVERLYLALGAAQHGRRESIRDVELSGMYRAEKTLERCGTTFTGRCTSPIYMS